MKKNFLVYASMLMAFTFLIFACNPVEPQEKKVTEEVKEEIKEEVKDNTAALKAEAEAEMKKLEEEVMKLSDNKRSGTSDNNRNVNPDDDCAFSCGKDGSVSRSEYAECMKRCRENMAKEKEKQEQENKEKEKQEFLMDAQNYFKDCIRNAKTEEQKKNCREIYMTDKEQYHNGTYPSGPQYVR